jgi:3-isopropylmalate dehydrogenase
MVEGTSHRIAVIAGDLNGVTVTEAALRLGEVATRRFASKEVAHYSLPYNVDYFLKRRIKELGDEELEVLRQFDQIFLGAIGDPTRMKPGVIENGLLLKVRQAFDQYVNLRPVILVQGVPSVVVGKGPADINFEICRENSEGFYVNQGHIENPGTDDEVAFQVMKCSYRGVKRLAEFAAERALTREGRRPDRKPRLHVVFKTNILTFAGSPWIRVYEEFKKTRKDLDVRYMQVDNFVMQMVQNPEQFDVVITENMFGDIATDLGAVLQGGIGVAVSGNLNPTRRFPSMFEPIHGTAPDKWYDTKDGEYVPGTFRPDLVQLVRPEAAFMSYAMMLEFIGEKKAADVMRGAALANLRNPDYKTKRLDELVKQACDFVSIA